MTRAALLLVAVIGCQRSSEPLDPVWGKQPCAQCVMLVDDRVSAAQLVTKRERFYFDDVGCLVLFTRAHPEHVGQAWVRAPSGDGWIEAERARYRDGAKTPMDYGFVPAADGIAFAEVTARVIERARP